MKDLLIAVMMVLGMFSITSCTKDVPTPTENSITTEMKVVIPPANDCGKDDDIEVILTIKVTDIINDPISEVSVQLEGAQNYNFATNNVGQYEEAAIETGNYTLSVVEDNATLVILDAIHNGDGVLNIIIQP